MTAREHIYYGFGQVVYSLAFSDGKIQREERRILEEILHNRLESSASKNISAIIFTLLDKDMLLSVQSSFELGIKNMKLGDNHLTPEMINEFNATLLDVAAAFPPNTEEEKEIISQFNEAFKNF